MVTPNKRLNSGPFAAYSAVKSLQASGAAHYMYEGTVGAGLPIISTLKNMLDTGDDVLRIEGVFRHAGAREEEGWGDGSRVHRLEWKKGSLRAP